MYEIRKMHSNEITIAVKSGLEKAHGFESIIIYTSQYKKC